MNQSLEEVKAFCKDFNFQSDSVITGIAAQAHHLSELKGKNFLVGSQNCYFEKKGAFTGELSATSLSDFGVNFTLIGHSERRHIFKENNEVSIKKTQTALEENLITIFCIGETLKDFEENKTFETLEAQLNPALNQLKTLKNFHQNFIIAYEPVWAIGTGKVATVEIISKTTEFIHQLALKHDLELPVLYGGSVKAQNCEDIANIATVQGVLVGGASLSSENFTPICNAFNAVS